MRAAVVAAEVTSAMGERCAIHGNSDTQVRATCVALFGRELSEAEYRTLLLNPAEGRIRVRWHGSQNLGLTWDGSNPPDTLSHVFTIDQRGKLQGYATWHPRGLLDHQVTMLMGLVSVYQQFNIPKLWVSTRKNDGSYFLLAELGGDRTIAPAYREPFEHLRGGKFLSTVQGVLSAPGGADQWRDHGTEGDLAFATQDRELLPRLTEYLQHHVVSSKQA
ncbi:MAG: hypothetical protein ACKVPX_04045 [Myxococcaceae bacterium]